MKTILFFSFLFISTSLFAQKVAFLEIDSIISAMPESKNAEAELNILAENLSVEIKTLNDSLNTINNRAVAKKNLGDLAPAEEQRAVQQIQQLQEAIATKKQIAEEKIAQKRSQLLVPIIAKINTAIEQTVAEYGYWMVFRRSDNLLYINNAANITPIIKNKMGLK